MPDGSAFGLVASGERDRFALGPERVEGIAAKTLMRPKTAEQRQFLRSATGYRRWCWNHGLRIWLDRIERAKAAPEGSEEQRKAWPSARNVRADLLALIAAGDGKDGREDLAWAWALDSRIPGEAIADLAKAWTDHRKNPSHFRRPKFQRKNDGPDSYRTTNDKVRFSKDGKKVQAPKAGWLELAEAIPNHGKLMSLTITRVGDNLFEASFSFAPVKAGAKRGKQKDAAKLKHPRKANPATFLPSIDAVAPKRRRLGTEKPRVELLASISDADVVGGDVGQRTQMTFSQPFTAVRHAGEPSIFETPEEISRTVVPTASGHRPGHRRSAAKTTGGTVEKVVERGNKVRAPKALAKALGQLARMQRRQARSLEMPVPPVADPAAPAPVDPARLERGERRRALRAEKLALRRGPEMQGPLPEGPNRPLRGRAARAAYKELRDSVRRRDAGKRRQWRSESKRKRKEKKAARRKELLHKKAGTRKAPPKARRTKREHRRHARIGDLHREVAAIRGDVQDKFTTASLRSFKCLVIEDLDGRALLRANGKGAAEMACGQIREMYRYKAALDRTLLIEACRWFPSSKRCSACGVIHRELKRGDVRWTCSSCGAAHDRDANAAENLAWYGRIVVRQLKGEDALSGLSTAERNWFVGPARPEVTRGKRPPPGDGGNRSPKSYGRARGTANEKEGRKGTACP